jgi:ABC-type polysaccharide/polyol phosphate transport system ATPase subunit
VLAAGDQTFQATSLDKIHDFQGDGKSLLCVLHASGMVQQIV